MSQNNKEDQILEKLEQILKVLSIQVGVDKSITERAWLLKLAGLDNKTISAILNTDVATIRTLISRAKKV